MNKLLVFAKRNRATIMSCVAGAGVVATAYFASEDRLVVDKALLTAAEEKGEPLTRTETAKTVAKHSWRTILCMVTTITLIFAADRVNKKVIAGALLGYGALRESAQAMEKELIEVLGEDKYYEIKDKVTVGLAEKKRDITKKFETPKKETPTGEKLYSFTESYSGREFFTTLKKVEEAEEAVKKIYEDDQYASLNDFYNALDIDLTILGDEAGWSKEMYDQYEENGFLDFKNNEVIDKETGEITGYVINYTCIPEVGFIFF